MYKSYCQDKKCKGCKPKKLFTQQKEEKKDSSSDEFEDALDKMLKEQKN